MALSPAVALFGLHLVNANLCALAALDDICGNGSAFNDGCAESSILAVDNGQNLIVNEYTKDTSDVHPDGEKVHLRFDPLRVSLYEAESGEVLSL